MNCGLGNKKLRKYKSHSTNRFSPSTSKGHQSVKSQNWDNLIWSLFMFDGIKIYSILQATELWSYLLRFMYDEPLTFWWVVDGWATQNYQQYSVYEAQYQGNNCIGLTIHSDFWDMTDLITIVCRGGGGLTETKNTGKHGEFFYETNTPNRPIKILR